MDRIRVYNKYDKVVIDDTIKSYKNINSLIKHIEKKYILDDDIIRIDDNNDIIKYKLSRDIVYKNYNDIVIYDVLFQRIEFKKIYMEG